MFRVAKIFLGLSGFDAYQPVFIGEDGSGESKSAIQSLVDENPQTQNDIVTHCFIMVMALFVQTLISARQQYLRQKSGCFSMDSADFGGLENPVVD
jgi:hypothetical protein